jgi:bifunctional non-homologous end joining protein LigD
MSKDDARTIAFTLPMECLPVEHLPEGEWALKLKPDGYRAQGIRDANRVRLPSRNDKDLSRKYPHVVIAVEKTDTVVDGELVAFDKDARPSFNALQRRPGLRLWCFSSLTSSSTGGRDIKSLPLSDRRGLLEANLIPSDLAQLLENRRILIMFEASSLCAEASVIPEFR